MITDSYGNKYYKLALHLHSTKSDGRLTPEEIARMYKANGYDAIALTDHWIYNEGGELEGLKIISGCEYNLGASDTVAGVMHIVGFGMSADPCIEKTAARQAVVDAINKKGGIAVLAHPAWSLNSVDDLAALSGIGATEIYNAVSEAGESLRAYSDYFVDLAANRELYPVILATDDAHYYEGNDELKGYVMVRAESDSTEDLMEAIRRGDLYASQGPTLSVKREGKKFIIDTSPVSVIAVCQSKAWSKNRVLRGRDLTHFEFTADDERWLRVEVIDASGRHAWSQVYPIEQ